MQFRRATSIASALAMLTLTAPTKASAEDAQGFVETQHHHLEQLLHEQPSPSRDTQVHQVLGTLVDYDELTRRAFGEPCPAPEPGCEDLWSEYSETQRAELRSLLEQLVRKTYQRNLQKTLDYQVTYRGSREAGSDTRVMTEAQNRLKPREPAVRVDYVLKKTPTGFKVVDIVTEGSSLAKNYYDQFLRKMKNPDEGYSNIVGKLREKIAKRD